jgi:hypothetical protein
MSAKGYQWGPEGGSLVPRCRGAHNTYDKANHAQRQRVRHRTIGREASRDVARRNAVDSAIDCRQQEESVAHRLAERREDAGLMQCYISADGENYSPDKARENCANAATDRSLSRCLANDLLLVRFSSYLSYHFVIVGCYATKVTVQLLRPVLFPTPQLFDCSPMLENYDSRGRSQSSG